MRIPINPLLMLLKSIFLTTCITFFSHVFCCYWSCFITLGHINVCLRLFYRHRREYTEHGSVFRVLLSLSFFSLIRSTSIWTDDNLSTLRIPVSSERRGNTKDDCKNKSWRPQMHEYCNYISAYGIVRFIGFNSKQKANLKSPPFKVLHWFWIAPSAPLP